MRQRIHRNSVPINNICWLNRSSCYPYNSHAQKLGGKRIFGWFIPACIMSKPPVLVIAAAQLLLVSLAGAGLHYGGKPVTALSVVIGGALCALPNAYFGLRAFRGMPWRGKPQPFDRGTQQRGARVASRVLENFYRGEAGKFVLTLAGFAAVFALVRPLNRRHCLSVTVAA